MKNIDVLTDAARNAALPDDAVRQCTALLARLDCEMLTRAFFSEMPPRRRNVSCKAPAARLGYFPDGFYPEREWFTPAKALFDSAGVRRESGFLAALVDLIPHTREIYRANALPDAVLAASLAKIGENACAFYASHGFYGVDDYVWLCCFLAPELFAVGSLEMRLCSFPYPAAHIGGKAIRCGDPVIQVHVPCHADISRQALDRSYAAACRLFGTDVFLADSWLLFPEHRQILPPDSNIRSFMADYTLLEVSRTFDYEGLFRIFGRRADYRYEDLPKDTALRRAYAERVRRGLPIGSAVGLFRFSGI